LDALHHHADPLGILLLALPSETLPACMMPGCWAPKAAAERPARVLPPMDTPFSNHENKLPMLRHSWMPLRANITWSLTRWMLGVGLTSLAIGAPPAERPNIIVLMADNWLYDHAGAN